MAEHPGDVVARNGLANVLRRLGQFTQTKSLLKDWQSGVGYQRFLDGIVFSLALVGEADYSGALRVLSALETGGSNGRGISSRDILRLQALKASVQLKAGQGAREEDFHNAPKEAPWLCVQLHWARVGGNAIAEFLQSALENNQHPKVRRIIELTAQLGPQRISSVAVNDELFEQEVELLMAA